MAALQRWIMRKRFLFLFVLLSPFSNVFPNVCTSASENPFEKSIYDSSFQEAIQVLANRYRAPFRFLEHDTYYLAYANESAASPAEYLTNTIEAIRIYSREAKPLLEYSPELSFSSAIPSNTLLIKSTLFYLKTDMKKICTAKFGKEKSDTLVKDFFEVLDLRAASAIFSGLPFFEEVLKRLRSPLFQNFVERLQQKLLDTVESLGDPGFKIETNLLEIAVGLTGGNYRTAIENLGILLARDVHGVHYIQFSPSLDRRVRHAMADIPLLVRLLAEVSRLQRNSNLDVFSYDGQFATVNVKNYYFWSSAYIALGLERRGHTSEEIQTITPLFTRGYKRCCAIRRNVLSPLYWISGTSFGSSEWDLPMLYQVSPRDKKFQLDALQVMQASAEGARRALKWIKPQETQ